VEFEYIRNLRDLNVKGMHPGLRGMRALGAFAAGIAASGIRTSYVTFLRAGPAKAEMQTRG